MAEVNTGGDDHGKKKGGKVHAKKQSTRIDMTPMVDLAFLLLTFFMLTATFNKPQVMEINMPVPPTGPDDIGTPVPKEFTTTILIGKDNKLFYYDGDLLPDGSNIKKSDFSKEGIRDLLISKNKKVYELVNEKKQELKDGKIVDSVYTKEVSAIKKNIVGNQGRVVIIKPQDDSAYENLIKILDEMAITNVATFAIAEITPAEVELLKTR